MNFSRCSVKRLCAALLWLGIGAGFGINQAFAQPDFTAFTSQSATSSTQLHVAQAEKSADLNYRDLSAKCTEGDALACKDLGNAYVKQYHKAHDTSLIRQGFSFFERGCALRDGESCYLRGLTILEAQQHGLDPTSVFNLTDVDSMLIESLVAGSKLKDRKQAADAFTFLAEIYQEKDRDKSIQYARQGCNLKNNDACYLMAISLWLMRVEGSNIETYLEGREADDVIITAFNKGTQANRLDYCSNSYYFLGYEYARKQMYENSTDAYMQGCKLNNDNACFFTGIAYEDGLGVRKDIHKAFGYYSKACQFGNSYGCERVRKLNLQGIYN